MAIIIEFKMGEPFGEDSLNQLLVYYVLKKKHKGLQEGELQSFLITSMTPKKETLQKYGYQSLKKDGVYETM